MAVSDIVPVPGARFEETLASASPDFLRDLPDRFDEGVIFYPGKSRSSRR